MKVLKRLPYYYEVHVAGYEGADFSLVPPPFFVNKIVSQDPITSIVTAEFEDFVSAHNAFELVRQWCVTRDDLIHEGCRVTLEQVLAVISFGQTLKIPSNLTSQDWSYVQSPFIPFADVHADGTWDSTLCDELVAKRKYLPLDYVARSGRKFRVLTLHFLTPEAAKREGELLQTILSTGGFTGQLSLERTLELEVIGPPITRPVIVS